MRPGNGVGYLALGEQELASSRPGNGIAQLALGEWELASARNWLARDWRTGIGQRVTMEQPQLVRDHGQEPAISGSGNRDVSVWVRGCTRCTRE